MTPGHDKTIPADLGESGIRASQRDRVSFLGRDRG
jgi:hypothetical protein